MSHFRVLNTVDGVVKATVGVAVRTVDALRAQAPGARMLGEFAVRMGVDQIKRRLTPTPPSNDRTRPGSATE